MNETLDLKSHRRKNVIWILTDQLRAQSLGIRGDANAVTPNIDNLARTGIDFTCAVSGAPWCCPFRGALLTGLYPHQCGVTKTPSALSPEIPTLIAPLKNAGYHTAWIGKWHLDGSNSREHYIPPERRGGFDYFMGYENFNNQNETYVFGSDSETPVRLPGYETDSLTDMLISHLRSHTNCDEDYKPFFAALSVQPPHSPYVTPFTVDGRYYRKPSETVLRPNVPHSKRVRDKAAFDIAGYSGMVENIDMNVGRLQIALRDMNIDRETVIMFFSDHGDCLGSHGQWEKSSPWEESIKIPFIISSVGGIYASKTGSCSVPLNHIDIAPTTLGICGVDVPKSMTGYDFSHIYTGAENRNAALPPDSAYLQQIPAKHHRHSVNRPWRGVLTDDGYKYVCMPSHDWLLFDLKDDPYETVNLCFDDAFSDVRARCHIRLQKWIDDTGDDFTLPKL